MNIGGVIVSVTRHSRTSNSFREEIANQSELQRTRANSSLYHSNIDARILKVRDMNTRLLKPKRAADLLGGVKPSTLKQWRWRGVGPAWVTLNGRVYYPAGPLAEFIRALPRGGGALADEPEAG